jgi:hypothetical protein
MNEDMIRAQSEAAYKQWAPQWRAQAEAHKNYPMKSLLDLENIGVGKAVLCVANGYSFEENIETIKKYQHNVDIMACDKTMGHLLDHGITPKYVMVCDANVDFERYCEKWKDQLTGTILLANVCGNPKWAKENWKDVYFFINKDILESEKEFAQISGCQNFIPAGTNVSNAMVVMLTQSDNSGRKNFFGYDKILLIGYDYSWRFDGKYYAFNEDGDGKDNYMRHIYTTTSDASFAYTSGNLAFSAQWFEMYIRSFNLPVVQCSPKSILQQVKVCDLEEQMQYRFKTENSQVVKEAINKLNQINRLKKQLENTIQGIQRDHWQSFMCSV